MPVNVVLADTKYYNEFKNDPGFGSNLGDFAVNMSGSVMEKVQVSQTINIGWGVTYAPLGGFNWNLVITGGTTLQITSDGNNFENDGFSAGDLVDIGINIGGIPFIILNNTVTYVAGTDMVITLSAPYAVPPGIIGIRIEGKSPLTALIWDFGLIGNGETFNVASKVSLNDQGYYSGTVGLGGPRDTTFQTMQRLGSFKDWQTGSAKVRYVSNPNTYVQQFEIVHDLTLVPYYLDGELSNLQNNIIPNLLNGTNSLKYVYDAGFRTTLSNPNTEKLFRLENVLGSVAWFGENFNGFNNNYNVKSIAYEEAVTAASADGILVGSKTRITVTVEKIVGGPFAGAERFGAYISYLPEQNEYQNTTLTDLPANFIYDRALNNAGLAGVAGDDFITDCSATIVGGELVVVIEMEYSPLQKAFIANKIQQSPTNYLIGIEVGDAALTSAGSDRLILLADVNEYDESADIPGLMDFDLFDIYPHDQQIGVGTGSTNMTSWNEDGLVVDYDFYLNLNQSAVINSLDFKLVAYNTITDQFFELDSFSFGVASSIISGGVQQLNQTTTRGYILKSADQFNDATLSTGANVGGLQHYTGRFAQKISWQEWIENLDVNTIFYNVAEPKNNLNFKSSNYSLLNDYEIRLAVCANIDGVSTLGVSGVTDYLFLSPTITVYDYEQDGGADVWSCVIETFNNANSFNLSGSVLSGQDTLFRTTWTNSGGPVASLSGLWGINRIEVTDEQGYEITEMSSLNDPAASQLLIPNSGTKLFMYLNAGDVVMECLVDGSLVTAGTNFNLSSRIHDTNFVIGGKITEQGIDKDTEQGIQKIIE